MDCGRQCVEQAIRHPETLRDTRRRVSSGYSRGFPIWSMPGAGRSRYPLAPSFAVVFKELGVEAMNKKYRSVLLASLVPAVVLGGVFAVVQAQNAGALAKAT